MASSRASIECKRGRSIRFGFDEVFIPHPQWALDLVVRHPSLLPGDLGHALEAARALVDVLGALDELLAVDALRGVEC